jgi:glycosyltransferase involved in cell wall biosynthesis
MSIPMFNQSSRAVVLDARVVKGSGGGPDKTILNSPRYLLPAGYRNLCVYMHPPGDAGFEQLRKKALEREAPFVAVPDRGPWDLSIIPAFLNLCRREKVQIWHGHDYKTNALGLLLRRFWPMRLVTTVHGWVEHTTRTPLYYRVDKYCLPRYEVVIGVSDDLVRTSIACGVPAERCLLIENGVDTIEYQRRLTVLEAKAKQGYPANRLLIGGVGRLSAEKGFDILIRAVDSLIKRGLDVGLWIIGEGNECATLQKLIDELGQGDRMRLVGYRRDTADLYQAMDLFCLSSLREGLPNVLLEAMALETPVVATRIAGVPRLVQHEQSGLLVEPNNESALTEALERMLRDQALRLSLARQARRTIETRYSFQGRMDKVRALYDRLLERGDRSQPSSALAMKGCS